MTYILNGEVYKQTYHKNFFTTSDGKKVAKIVFSEDGQLKSYFLMNQEILKLGYKRIEIDRKHKSVHRLVYQAWSDEKLDDSLVIDHIDANPTNNDISNLRQCTQQQNIHFAIQNGNFGHSGDRQIKVTDKETGIVKCYPSFKSFLREIDAPQYMLDNGGLSTLRKRREYNRYSVERIDER